jgi:dimethylargininase
MLRYVVEQMVASQQGTSKQVNLQMAELLRSLAWDVHEAPKQEHGKTVLLEGSDVLYTGREIFVGIRKNRTNVEGALVVARTFPDLSVISIPIGGQHPLKHHVALAGNDVLAVGKSREAQSILHRLERDAIFRYKTLTVENEEAVCCMNVNDHVVFRHDLNEGVSGLLGGC